MNVPQDDMLLNMTYEFNAHNEYILWENIKLNSKL